MENNIIKKNRTGLWGGKGYEENGYIYKLIEKMEWEKNVIMKDI